MNDNRKKICRVPFGFATKSKQTAFLAIVCRKMFGYGNKQCAGVLMINRSDGRFSFPGGEVKSVEFLVDAVTREVEEEIGHKQCCRNLIPVCSHSIFTVDMHLFCTIVDYQEMLKIQRNAFSAQHFGTEVTGTNIVQLVDYGEQKGLVNFLGNNLVDGASEQLFVLAKEQSLMNTDQLISCYNQANRTPYSYQTEECM